jgi:hypothetical protein
MAFQASNLKLFNTLHMSKKVFIILFVLGLLLIGAMAFVLIRQRSSPNPISYSTYSVSVTEKNGIISASLIQDNKTTALDNQSVSQYALLSFNNPHDVLWVNCPNGFNFKSAVSSSGNSVIIDPIIGASIELLADKQNNITVTCTK